MQLTRKILKKVNIYSANIAENGYVGRRSAAVPLGFVYAEVFPGAENEERKRNGRCASRSATLILRTDAGVGCGDFAGVFSDSPDSRIVEVLRSPGHVTVRTESI